MVVCKFLLAFLVLVFCVIGVHCDTAGRNHCGAKIPCDDSQCIDRNAWCDGVTDCNDESDEKYCDKKFFWTTPDNNCDAEIHFTCKNKMCIPKVLKCDGHDDCFDDSDENDCDSSESGETEGSQPEDNFNAVSSQTDVPQHLSSTGHSLNNRHVVEPTVNYYGQRWTEGGITQQPPYNSANFVASAYLTQDSRSLPPSTVKRDGRFANSGGQAGVASLIRGAHLPSQECDKTIGGSDDDSISYYSVPWSHFIFESSHSEAIKNQYNYNARKAKEWLLAQRDEKLIWGENTPRALVALSLNSDDFNNWASIDILRRRLRIDLGARLIKWQKEPLSTSELALYINALIATCQNPRNMLGIDLVDRLYKELQREPFRRPDASPFPYLTLCLVDKTLTEDDRRFLLDIARRPVTDEISKDKFILATSALACLKKTEPYNRDLERSVEEAFHKLQQQQLNDGSYGSVYSTALAAQAFIAIDSRSWNPQSTLRYLSNKQSDDGSFGDFLATYYALPVLNGKSLLHLRNIQCQTSPPPSEPPTEPPTTTTRRPENTLKTIHYTLATQNPDKTLAKIELVVPKERNFFDIMKEAQAQDEHFRFLSVEHDNKIDVYQINGLPNDPEFGLFWILYEIKGRHGHRDDRLRYTEDIRDLVPEDSDELLFLLRTI